MIFTDDEITVLIEALREYRLRVIAGSGRHVLCDALIFRFGHQLLTQTKERILAQEQTT